MPEKPYDRLISVARMRASKKPENEAFPEAARSDYARVIYAPAFRRLQQKAQVFPLEQNPFVRGRLTHSLEVAYLGRAISQRVAERLVKQDLLAEEHREPFVTFIETACLLHDIGNPPFGHYGEKVIQEWFRDHGDECFKEATGIESIPREYREDFVSFDGNAQGLRVATRLRRDVNPDALNLTLTLLLTSLKYPRLPFEEDTQWKKPGCFKSEQHFLEHAQERLGSRKYCRFPLTYIVDVADEIAYCSSDIEDGVEKRLLKPGEVLDDLRKLVEEEFKADEPGGTSEEIRKLISEDPANGDDERRFFRFKTRFTPWFIQYAVEAYLRHHEEVLKGERTALFDAKDPAKRFLDVLRRLAWRLYRSPEAEKLELAGDSVISGLLDAHRPLLECSRDQFESLVLAEQTRKVPDGLDLHLRLFDRLPRKHLAAYRDSLERPEDFDFLELLPLTNPDGLDGAQQELAREWFARAHLVVDYVSGMTDQYALETFQLLSGIRVD